MVAYLKEERQISRAKATIIATISMSVLGVFATLSFGPLAHFDVFGLTIFGLLNYASANVLLTFGALLIVIFVGWRVGKSAFIEEISNQGTITSILFNVIFFIIRYIAPIAIGTVAVAAFFIEGLTG